MVRARERVVRVGVYSGCPRSDSFAVRGCGPCPRRCQSRGGASLFGLLGRDLVPAGVSARLDAGEAVPASLVQSIVRRSREAWSVADQTRQGLRKAAIDL